MCIPEQQHVLQRHFSFILILRLCACVRPNAESYRHRLLMPSFATISVQTHKVSSNRVQEWPQGISTIFAAAAAATEAKSATNNTESNRGWFPALLDTFSRCKILMFTFFLCCSIQFNSNRCTMCDMRHERHCAD